MSIYTAALRDAIKHGFSGSGVLPPESPSTPSLASSLKDQRHNLIRALITGPAAAASQSVILAKLAERGILVTQATLSRDFRELRLIKGPTGYFLPAQTSEDGPQLANVLADFGLEVRQAANLLVFLTTMGGAQPVAASLDQAAWPEIVGTVAGENTVLIICADLAAADQLRTRLEGLLG